jgi:hypothetical protein
MSRALQVLREEKSLLQRQLSAIDGAIAALSETTETATKRTGSRKGKPMSEQGALTEPKKHGRVWTPAMRAAASKRAKARLAKNKKS